MIARANLIKFMHETYCINKAFLLHLPGGFSYTFETDILFFQIPYATMLSTFCLVLEV